MFLTVLWIIVGLYFLYLGVEIIFFKVTKRIGSLETNQYKNKKAFIFRVGIIELIGGVGISAAAIYAIFHQGEIIVSYNILDITQNITYSTIPIFVAIVDVIALWLNQVFSVVKQKNNEGNENRQ